LKKFLGAVIFILGLVASCTNTDSLDQSSIGISDVDSLGLADHNALSNDDVDEVSYENGFCRDDVYAKYWSKEYSNVKTMKQKLRGLRSRRSRNRARKQYKYDALHYASNQMNGKKSPYFGGIPVVVNERVEFWINYYKNRGRRTFLRWLVRGESMKPIVLPILEREGIPKEFFYLAMVESGFNHGAYSSASATGTWQFMYGTAKLFDLKINHWVDERRDPMRSTVAAATFLKELYAKSGDWYLSMAGYNAGPGRIRRAIRRTKTRDFWKIAQTLHLNRETSNYVPKVLAAILLAADPVKHGFNLTPDPNNLIPETSVHISRPVRLAEVAKELGLPLKVIKKWNPELIRGITPPSKGGYQLRLTTDYAEKFASIEPNLTELDVTDVHMYKIRSGDTLSTIARRYKVRIRQILSINPKLRARTLRIGRRIAIPVPGVVTKRRA
jgi:membrane-bound lytic murein transglycosylase D